MEGVDIPESKKKKRKIEYLEKQEVRAQAVSRHIYNSTNRKAKHRKKGGDGERLLAALATRRRAVGVVNSNAGLWRSSGIIHQPLLDVLSDGGESLHHVRVRLG